MKDECAIAHRAGTTLRDMAQSKRRRPALHLLLPGRGLALLLLLQLLLPGLAAAIDAAGGMFCRSAGGLIGVDSDQECALRLCVCQ